MGFFGSLGLACKAKKEKLCQSPLGKMLATVARPMHMMTGGLLPSCCPPGPSPAEMAAPGPVGAAAKIKAEEAQAKARREAVKFLATVDCHYYPEAEATLIGALRCDRNECVRWEAAHALGTGCCCNKRTIEALTITVSASERDGNPSETSFRVRVEAMNALQFCLSRSQDTPIRPETPLAPEQPASLQLPGAVESKPNVQLTSYYTQVTEKPMGDIQRDARHALEQNSGSPTPSQLPKSGERNLLTLWRTASIDQNPPAKKLEPTPLPSPAHQSAKLPPEKLLVQPLPPVFKPASPHLDPPLPRFR